VNITLDMTTQETIVGQGVEVAETFFRQKKIKYSGKKKDELLICS